ncbi:MAG: hypothetical protein ACLQQ4_18010 [Bacteroidia bacterium]
MQQKNIRVRPWNNQNKQNIARTLALLLDGKNKIPAYIQARLVKDCIWTTTEHNDTGLSRKYLGQPYWSEGALNQVRENRKAGKNIYADLRHEHAVPKAEIIRMINALPEKSDKNIYDILDKFGYAVVVNKTEDADINRKGYRSKMPTSFTGKNRHDVFMRYSDTGITLFDVRKHIADVTDLTETNIQQIISTKKRKNNGL